MYGYVFNAFESFTPLGGYKRNLPHWRKEGAIYFVTFRLADSIPASVLQKWMEERRAWLTSHGLIGEIPDSEWESRYLDIPEDIRQKFEREEMRKYFVELDKCHGKCFLKNKECTTILRNALLFFNEQRLLCGDFVIMPNHVHWIVTPLQNYELENIMQSVKSYSARCINKSLGRHGRLWQKESFDHIVRNPPQLERIRNYIEQNPHKAKIPDGSFLYHKCDWL